MFASNIFFVFKSTPCKECYIKFHNKYFIVFMELTWKLIILYSINNKYTLKQIFQILFLSSEDNSFSYTGNGNLFIIMHARRSVYSQLVLLEITALL